MAETIGLGATLLIGILLFAQWESHLGPVLTALLGVVLGACLEGGIVGTAQWLVLHGVLAELTWWRWAFATAIGAGIAWTLGMTPSTLFALVGTATDETTSVTQEPGGLMLYGAAAALGLVAGAILALAQWRVLSRYVPRAGWWLLANACAWALGMVLIFVGTGFIPASGITLGIAALLVISVVVAGAVVSATDGLVLIWLLRLRDLDRLRTGPA